MSTARACLTGLSCHAVNTIGASATSVTPSYRKVTVQVTVSVTCLVPVLVDAACRYLPGLREGRSPVWCAVPGPRPLSPVTEVPPVGRGRRARPRPARRPLPHPPDPPVLYRSARRVSMVSASAGDLSSR